MGGDGGCLTTRIIYLKEYLFYSFKQIILVVKKMAESGERSAIGLKNSFWYFTTYEIPVEKIVALIS